MSARSWRAPALAAAAALIPVLSFVPAASADPNASETEQAISKALNEWMLAFNAGDTGAVCRLFAPELRYDYRGFPERGFAEVCSLLQVSEANQRVLLHRGRSRLRRALEAYLAPE